jgi:hypothetical protein
MDQDGGALKKENEELKKENKIIDEQLYKSAQALKKDNKESK